LRSGDAAIGAVEFGNVREQVVRNAIDDREPGRHAAALGHVVEHGGLEQLDIAFQNGHAR
jgi:hypothetical protein